MTNLDPLGNPLGCQGDPISPICQKLDVQFQANVSKVLRLRIEYYLPEFSPGSSGSSGSGICTAVRNPLPRAGGQDDVSLEETPSDMIYSKLNGIWYTN